MAQSNGDEELREQLQGISYKAVVSAYNTSQAGLIDYAHELTEELLQLFEARRKQHELDARIKEVEQLIPEPVMEMASINYEDELKRHFGYLREHLAELKAEREQL